MPHSSVRRENKNETAWTREAKSKPNVQRWMDVITDIENNVSKNKQTNKKTQWNNWDWGNKIMYTEGKSKTEN